LLARWPFAVDDEYIIVGSANINQRSMDGGLDTEIAMGAYQPRHLATRNQPGDVHGFRVALWQEHLGQVAAAAAAGELLLQPSSLACVRRMNQVAQQHWDMFASDTFQGDLHGHQRVRLAYQPPANSTFLSEQTSISHQPPAKRTGCTSGLCVVLGSGLFYFRPRNGWIRLFRSFLLIFTRPKVGGFLPPH
jgi:hypothetical protein